MKKTLGTLLVLLGVLLSLGAVAQKYPTRPISMIVPWSAGGSTDLTARALAPVLEKTLGQPIRVENRTGGGGAIGHSAIAQGGPDGYNIGIITLEVVLPPWVAQTRIDATAFTPIALLVLNPVAIVVRKDSPFKTVQDLIADIRKNPGKLKASGTARAGSYDFARLGFLKNIGAKDAALPWVPAQGAAAALQELIAGGINVAFVAIGEAAALVKSGEARYLAFMTEKRFPSFAEVPTLKEVGVDWVFASFLMAAAPKHTLPSVARQLDVAFAKAVQDPDFVKFMNNANLVINHLSFDKTKAFLAERSKAMNELAAELK
jgi:tripartite-type tricarboxylate transporter receptor subunit TctC